MKTTYPILAAVGLLITVATFADAQQPARELPHDLEMELALSALPPHLRAEATVYLATQESLHRNVVLKILDDIKMDESDLSERFMAEGRILASLNHPNIITIYDIGIANDRLADFTLYDIALNVHGPDYNAILKKSSIYI